MFKFYLNLIDVSFSDTQRENRPSNKPEAFTKIMNMYIGTIGALNQLFIRGSYSQIEVGSDKSTLLVSILYSLLNMP